MSEEKKLVPTDEQQEIIDAAKQGGRSLMIEADAGATKTTTLKMLSKTIRGGCLGLAFNKSTAKELGEGMPGNIVVKTANGLGHGAWIRANPGVSHWSIEDKKLGKLITEKAKGSKLKLTSEQWDSARQLVTKAMQEGVTPNNEGRPLMDDTPENWQEIAEEVWIPEDEREGLIRLAKEVLIESIALARKGQITFDDQIYCSVCLGGRFVQYEDVLADEAQDLNKLNHQMIALSTRREGRLIAVGDPKQSIYSFRGAVDDSMRKLKGLKPEGSWIDLPLHLTFRCPKKIVEKQQHHAPGFKAWHLNPEGVIRGFPLAKFDNEGMYVKSWKWQDVMETMPHLSASLAILCRNNAPLLKMAFKLIRRRVSVNMLGGQLGKNLVALSKKIIKDDATPKDRCAGLIAAWRDLEMNSALMAGRDDKMSEIADRAGCLEAVLDDAEVRDAGQMRAVLEQLFSREVGQVTLGTGHKAKGLEWDAVVHLDPWRVSGKLEAKALAAGDPIPLQQVKNLHYVIDTRVRHTLIEANLEDFQ